MKLSFFLPKQPIFFDLFIGQTREILEIAQLLQDLTKLNHTGELPAFSVKAKNIEHQADDLTHEVIKRLNLTFITPIDREDIYDLAVELDDIVDKLENVIHNIEIYQVKPQEKFLAEFSAIILPAAQKLGHLMESLKLQQYSELFIKTVRDIHDLEDQGDELFLNTLSHLFSNGADAISIIKLKDIAEDLERVVDKFQSASNTVENILVKSQ
ncbi:MAG: DUF47 family protein [Candidatus Komeilibacteria bacterium]|nr:DUF47 family protein [Candidatus Komeilibacteria bacterium]